ncbi:MAG: hypothetical protein ACRENP_13540 [Longimicrobiales bacterium]
MRKGVAGVTGVTGVSRWRTRVFLAVLFTVLPLLATCSDGDEPVGPPGVGYLEVDSDPRGASIFVDGQDRRKVTPDTLHGLRGTRDITVRLDSAGGSYGFRVQLELAPDSIVRVLGPLTLARCNPQCPLVREHTASRIRFGRAAEGPLFYRDGSGNGAFWPNTTTNSYISVGMPMFSALLDGQIPIALGIYDLNYVAGRPFPRVTTTASEFSLNQSFWLIPPGSVLGLPTVRGLEVREEVIAASGNDDVVVVELTFRNITNRLAYQSSDPFAPAGGFRFQDAFFGFALDPDIGVAEDDLFTYDPELNAVIAYDAAFREDAFQGASTGAPGLIGLRLLDAPSSARRVLNGWPRLVAGGLNGDWSAGTPTEPNGYTILSGANAYAPDHASNTIGHLPGLNVHDHRMAVSAGPITLSAGDSVVIRVAIAFAEPAAGTFTSGTAVDSGNPQVATRTIMRIAEPLRARLRAADNIR